MTEILQSINLSKSTNEGVECSEIDSNKTVPRTRHLSKERVACRLEHIQLGNKVPRTTSEILLL